MTVPFQGGCRCGAIRYEATAEPLATVNCHCRDCQYASGTGYSTVVVVPTAAFRLIQGTTKAYASLADSGNTVRRHFCPDCGTPLFGENVAKPEMVALKAASLDDPSGLTIAAALFTKSAQPWCPADPARPVFETMPPPRG